jgi:hypothetical protein
MNLNTKTSVWFVPRVDVVNRPKRFHWIVSYVFQMNVINDKTAVHAHVSSLSSRQGLGIFLFTTASRPALGPAQPIQWVPGALSLGIKRPGREADHSPPSCAEVKEWVELYIHSPSTLSWCGAKLKAQGQLYLTLFHHHHHPHHHQ